MEKRTQKSRKWTVLGGKKQKKSKKVLKKY